MGDTFFTTNNEILIRNTLNSPTIMCMQRKAEKVVPTEDDIVKANILGFGDDIGKVTNHITSMIEKQSLYPSDSEEYKLLSYRIMCGQLYQQASIDRVKGIIAKPMPQEWYTSRANRITDDDSELDIKRKNMNMKVLADKKPYFMIYVYPSLKSEYTKYVKQADSKCNVSFNMSVNELRTKQEKTDEEIQFLKFHDQLMPVGVNPCVVNRIAWLLEDEFGNGKKIGKTDPEFDYTILKSGTQYTSDSFREIRTVYEEYLVATTQLRTIYMTTGAMDCNDWSVEREMLANKFATQCHVVCPNEYELCDIVLDMCYTSEKLKQFAWDICGDTIIENLLKKNGNRLCYPIISDSECEFEYAGKHFAMREYNVDEEKDMVTDIDYTE